MKLKTYLNRLKATDIVSIGSKNGVGYMYIGEAGNVEQIIKEFENYRDKIANRLEKSKVTEAALVMSIPEAGNVHGYAREVAKRYTIIENCEKYLDSYIDPLKRDICEVDGRVADEGRRVIIRGFERGDFWFKHEYDEQRG